MLKRRKKISSSINNHRYAFISYDDENGNQWDFSKTQLFLVVFLCVSLVGTGLFFAFTGNQILAESRMPSDISIHICSITSISGTIPNPSRCSLVVIINIKTLKY